MKDFEPKIKEEIELSIKKKKEVEYELLGIIKPKSGHFVWELNEETGKVKKAEYEKRDVAYNALAIVSHDKLIINPNCVYIPALNAKNAIKKYLNDNKQSSYYIKEAPMDIRKIFN